MPAAFYFNSAMGGTQVKSDRLGRRKNYYLLAAAANMYNYICGHWKRAGVGSAYNLQASF